jgi:hypothetical protein
VVALFDFLERHWPQWVNAIESELIPKTNNAVEMVIRQDAQVDWGEAQVLLAGAQVMVYLFVMRLCYSRKIFVMAFPSQKQECFLAGHVAAFHFLGGIPRRLTYDNLKAAVKKILIGPARQEQASFIVFRSHYLFESHSCTPGAGHERGRVEDGVGYARRNFMSPLLQADNFAIPHLNKQRVLDLARGEYIHKAEPIILVGQPGLGKSHIAVGLAVAACRQCQRVRFYNAAALVNELLQAQEQHRLPKVLAAALKQNLIVLDELGFIPFSTAGAQLLFQFCSITSYKSLGAGAWSGLSPKSSRISKSGRK